MSHISASDITRIFLFAPKDCTGNSGAVGDTILQTSFARTLLDRSLFPSVQEIHWWGTKWVINELFPYFQKTTTIHGWNGEVTELEKDAQYNELVNRINAPDNGITAVFVCTRSNVVKEKLKNDIGAEHCYLTAKPLDAQSSMHLSLQLHSCLNGLGLYVSNPPQPRIMLTQNELNSAIGEMKLDTLREKCEISIEGKHRYELGVDRVFLLHPGLRHGIQDRRTWNVDKWRELARILSEVGVVIVACDARDVPEARDEIRAAQEIVTGEQTYNWRFAKKLELKDLAAWACASTVCVARDSGPMHVAAAAIGPKGRARVLGLFSVMCPDTWRPLSDSFKGLGQWPLPLEPYVTPDKVAVEATQW